MTDWIEHNGGPQPVGDDVWICVDAMPEEMEEVGAGYVRLPKQVGSWNQVTGFFVINQHLIDAARREGILLGLEAAAKVADLYSNKKVVSHIRWLQPDIIAAIQKPDTIAREAQDMGSEKEADL